MTDNMGQPQVHQLQEQPHDFLTSRLQEHGRVALRMNDALHSHVNVGDMVEFHGHGSIMDQQRYKVLSRMDHPSVESAVNSIGSSNLAIRDKIQLSNSFRDLHAPHLADHVGPNPVTVLHLAPHPGPPPMNRSIGGL